LNLCKKTEKCTCIKCFYHELLITNVYVFFWVIPRRLNFICQRFGTVCLFHLHSFGSKIAIFEPNIFSYKYPNFLNPGYSSYLPACEDGTECSETLACKIQTTGNYPDERIQHSEHGESLKSRITNMFRLFLQSSSGYLCRSTKNKINFQNLAFDN
jgi:hypothetical protein